MKKGYYDKIPYNMEVECRVMTKDNKERIRKQFENNTRTKKQKTMEIFNQARKETNNTNTLINDIVKRLLNKEDLTKEQMNLNDKVANEMRANGIAPTGAYHFETRGIVDTYEKEVGTNVHAIDNLKGNDILLKSAKKLKGLTMNAKIPYITSKGVEWYETGFGELNTDSNIKGKNLRARRITTNVLVSREMILNDGITTDFERLLFDAVQDKLIETIFSHTAEGTQGKSNPKGILNDISSTTITSVNDLINLQYEVDKNKVNGTWVLSPMAKQYVQSISTDYPIYNNHTMLNSNAIFDSRVEDGYIVYLDLSKLYIADWKVSSITIDPITMSKDGLVGIYCDYFVDFSYLDNDFIKVGVITPTSQEDDEEDTPTPPIEENESFDENDEEEQNEGVEE